MDWRTLTTGELAKVSEIAGKSAGWLKDHPDDPATDRFAIGMAYVAAKRKNPAVTIAEVEAMTMDEVEEYLGNE